MKKIQALLQALVYPACTYFSLALLFFYTFGSAVKGTRDVVLSFRLVGLLFAFGAAMALCGLLFRLESMNMIVKVTLHFTGTVFAFVMLLVVMSGYFANTSGGLIITLIFCFFYFLIAAVLLGVRALFQKKANEESRYTSQFEKLKNKE